MRKFFKNISIFILANALFFNLASLTIDYWSLPARYLVSLYIIFVPVLTFILIRSSGNLKFQINQISPGWVYFLAGISLLVGIILTLSFPHKFNTTILVEPKLSSEQEIELIEIKADGHVIPLTNLATDFGWEFVNNSIIARQDSSTLNIKARLPAHSKISMIFGSSPASGKVGITIGYFKEDHDLRTAVNEQRAFSFTSKYRIFPNWFFIPFLVLTDVLAFGFICLVLLLLQETGQQVNASKRKSQVVSAVHRKNLIILLSFSVLLHLINLLSVPLILGVDSPSYLRGAVHLVNTGNFQGVSVNRGVGTTLLFAPVFALFGRNPWGIKILLHLLAIACVPLAYWIAWRLNSKSSVAFMAGAATLLLPDLFFFSNYVMSDLPNIFFTLLFCLFLILSLQTSKTIWTISSLLCASYCTLLRSENIILLFIGIFSLAVVQVPNWLKIKREENRSKMHNRKADLLRLGLAIFLALLPILLWSYHNFIQHGFFGLSQYAREVVYTGWIYYGEASGFPISDPDSEAVKAIDAAFQAHPVELDESGVLTGWRAYSSLTSAGYSSDEAFNLLATAAKDSILNNPKLSWSVMWAKITDGLTPETTVMVTHELLGESLRKRVIESQFFEEEILRIPILIKLQRQIYGYVQLWFERYYQIWVYIGIIAMVFCLFRKPELVWGSLVVIVISRIFIPDIMGNPVWRYTLLGIPLLQILAISWIVVTAEGLKITESKK